MEALAVRYGAEETAGFCGTHHGSADTAGYVAVLTRFGHGKVIDLAEFGGGAGAFGAAIEYTHKLRGLIAAAEQTADRKSAGYYVRLDVIYNDGCRYIR